MCDAGKERNVGGLILGNINGHLYLIMYADTESGIDLIEVDQPSHTHEHQVQVVHG